MELNPTCFTNQKAFEELQPTFPGFPEGGVVRAPYTRRAKVKDSDIDQLYETLRLFDLPEDPTIYHDHELVPMVDWVFHKSMKSLLNTARDEVFDVLEWLFMDDMTTLADSRGECYVVKTEFVPFSFRMACKLFHADFTEVRRMAVLTAYEHHIFQSNPYDPRVAKRLAREQAVLLRRAAEAAERLEDGGGVEIDETEAEETRNVLMPVSAQQMNRHAKIVEIFELFMREYADEMSA